MIWNQNKIKDDKIQELYQAWITQDPHISLQTLLSMAYDAGTEDKSVNVRPWETDFVNVEINISNYAEKNLTFRKEFPVSELKQGMIPTHECFILYMENILGDFMRKLKDTKVDGL